MWVSVFVWQDKLEAIVLNSAATAADPGGMGGLWNTVKDKMYSLSDKEKELGLGDKVSVCRQQIKLSVFSDTVDKSRCADELLILKFYP